MPRNHRKAKILETQCAFCGTPITRVAYLVKNPSRVFCNRTCAAKTYTPPHNIRPLATRFWEKVNKDGPILRPDIGACWVWTAKIASGYGKINIGNRFALAHRVSWEIHSGLIPDGLQVLHRCDNPPCVRPDHLFLGTQQDNAIDMAEKGRQRNQVLSREQVLAIRVRYQRGGITWRELGIQYGVTRGHIGNIIHRKVRRHVQ